MGESVDVWYNPRCSKCRTTSALLAERGIEPHHVEYLQQAPSRADIERVMGMLGIDDPRAMMRTGEDVYKELDLADADRDRLLEAMTEHPILIERPIVIRGDKAVIGRPPERALQLFES